MGKMLVGKKIGGEQSRCDKKFLGLKKVDEEKRYRGKVRGEILGGKILVGKNLGIKIGREKVGK